MIGSTIAHYRITAKLGQGGMGDVYRASDTKLSRDVALKVLPEIFASDADRMARFTREAQVLAALNHPNIAQIYGVEDRALVMELVEGATLQGPLPLDIALDYARQIAAALEAAHEKGIVHRDLKPANIKVTPDGVVKVLDFGLAKAAESSPADAQNLPTLTISPTAAGVILGTAAYMAPEQARGKPVDKRADIWAYGAVLYEMLTGRQLFQGDTISDVLASVLTKEPDLSPTPPEVRRLLQSCLQKDPKLRLQSIGDARLLLDPAPAQPMQAVAPPARTSRLPWIVAATLAVALAAALLIPRHPRQPLQPLLRFDVDLGSDVSLSSAAGAQAILSPDGTRMVFCSQARLYLRRLDQPKAVELPGTDSAYAPFFSPDGQWVGFFTPGELRKISVQGGSAVTLCPAPNAFGASWGEDGNIVAALSTGGLSRIPSAGGPPGVLLKLESGEFAQRWPQVLPGGKGVLFTSYASPFGVDGTRIEVFSGGRRKILQRGGIWARYAPSGHLLYLNGGTLFAVPFDVNRLAVRDTPVPILLDVAHNTAFGSTFLDFSGAASGAGAALYQSRGSGLGLTTVQWLDTAGVAKPLLPKAGDYIAPLLSPDGKRLAVTSAGDIWVYDVARETMTKLTTSGGQSYAVWTPDGRYLILGDRGGMAWVRADGAGKPQPLTRSDRPQFPFTFSASSRRLAYMELGPQTGFDIWTVPLEIDGAGVRTGQPQPFLQTSFDERHPALSPDSRWMAYVSNESGNFQVYVRAFPARDSGTDSRWPISNGGGLYPAWSSTGHELLFRTMDNKVMAASYKVEGDSFVADKPRLWSEKRLANAGIVRSYDVAPDGKHIAAIMAAEGVEAQSAQNHVILLMNFFDELRRRVPMK